MSTNTETGTKCKIVCKHSDITTQVTRNPFEATTLWKIPEGSLRTYFKFNNDMGFAGVGPKAITRFTTYAHSDWIWAPQSVFFFFERQHQGRSQLMATLGYNVGSPPPQTDHPNSARKYYLIMHSLLMFLNFVCMLWNAKHWMMCLNLLLCFF